MQTDLQVTIDCTPLHNAEPTSYDFPDEPIHLPGKLRSPRPHDALPPKLANYIVEIAKNTQTPEEMSIFVALVIIAIAVQDKAEIYKNDGYKEPLIFWVLVFLEPGNRKSRVFELLLEPIIQYEARFNKKHKELLADNQSRRKVCELEIAKLEKQLEKQTSKSSKEAIIKELNQARIDMPDEVLELTCFVSDVTSEKLAQMALANKGSMAVCSDEADGIIENWTGQYSNGRASLDLVNKAFGAASHRIHRIGRNSITLPRVSISICLAAQPSVLHSFDGRNKDKLMGTGFAARFQFILPDSPVGSRNVRDDYQIDPDHQNKFYELIDELMSAEPGHSRADGLRRINLSPEAVNEFDDFAQYVEDNMGRGKQFEPFQDWAAKLPGAVLRIAGLCHIAEFGLLDDPSTVNIITMKRAILLGKTLIEHRKRAIGMLGVDPVVKDAMKLLEFLRSVNGSRVKRSDFQGRSPMKHWEAQRLNKAIKELESRNIISPPFFDSANRGGQYFFVNPKIHADIEKSDTAGEAV